MVQLLGTEDGIAITPAIPILFGGGVDGKGFSRNLQNGSTFASSRSRERLSRQLSVLFVCQWWRRNRFTQSPADHCQHRQARDPRCVQGPRNNCSSWKFHNR